MELLPPIPNKCQSFQNLNLHSLKMKIRQGAKKRVITAGQSRSIVQPLGQSPKRRNTKNYSNQVQMQ
jgi:hypothetical protein